MQIRIFSVPVVGGEAVNEELNAFLRGRRILQVEQQLVNGPDGSYWSFCVRYLEGPGKAPDSRRRRGKDYKHELSPEAFQRFSRLRAIRKAIAQEDGVPAFAVFTNEELAGLAQLTELTPSKMKSVKGIGEKKVEKFAARFIKVWQDEESQPPDAPDN